MRYLARGEIPGCFYSTFNLPNFTAGASIISGTPGLVENGGVPKIVGFTDWWSYGFGNCSPTGAFGNRLTPYSGKVVATFDSSGTLYAQLLDFDSSRVSSVYDSSTKVYASGVKVRICIKY